MSTQDDSVPGPREQGPREAASTKPGSSPGPKPGPSPGPGPNPGNLLKAGSIVSAMTLLSRITGFLRDIALASFIGASGTADAFFVAFRIPNFFRRLFAEGAFNQAFVPVLMRYRERGRDELVRFIAVIGGNLTLALLLLVLVGVAFAPAVTSIFAPGFRDDPRFDTAAQLLQITFPYIGFISLVAFSAAILNAHQRYAAPAFAPVLLNLVMLASIGLGNLYLPGSIEVLAWGVLIAGIAQWLFLVPALGRIGLLVAPRPTLAHDGARQVGKLLIPAVLAASVGQINALIDSMLASLLETGSVSWLYYADRLLEMPVGLVAVALGTVLLPSLARLDARGESAAFARLLDWGLSLAGVMAFPAAAALYVLAVPLISTLFLHGEMREYDVRMAALALQAFAVGLVPMVLVKVLAPAFFAQQDTRTPFRIAIVAIASNIIVNLAVFRWFGHVGLAFGTTASAFVNAGLLWRGLVRRNVWVPGPAYYRLSLRTAAATAVMAGLLWWWLPADDQWLVAPTAQRALWISIACAGGLAVYGVLLVALGVRPGHLLHRPE